MANEFILEQLTYLCNEMLNINCPVMSGNMNDTIEIIYCNKEEAVLCVNAPKYDIPLWEETGEIRYTGEGFYAVSVNEYGGFKSGNASKHWVNRALYNACCIIASQNNGEVILDHVQL